MLEFSHSSRKANEIRKIVETSRESPFVMFFADTIDNRKKLNK